MYSVRSMSCALFALALACVPASAQSITFPASAPLFSATEQSGSASSSNGRSGFWFSGGLGIGSLGCEDCDERETSGMLDLVFGGTLGDRLLLGGAITGWSKEEDGLELTVTSLEARLRFYPIADNGFFLSGGLGVGSIRAAFQGFGDESENGVGLTLGLGYDFRVSDNISITPFWQGTAVSAGDSDANFGSLGVAITIH